MTRKPQKRAELELPHRKEYVRSNERIMEGSRMPDTLKGLLRWYQRAWSDETPDRLHVRGVWTSNGQGNRGIPPDVPGVRYQGQPLARFSFPGGSATGAPQTSDPFRAWLEDHPGETDKDDYYRTPLREAMRKMANGQGRASGRPLIARWLHRVAMAGFDWRRAADSVKKDHQEAEMLTWKGLEVLWRLYVESPDRAREAA